MHRGTILYIGGFELPDKDAAAHRVLSNAKIFRKLGYNVVFIDVDRSLEKKLEISNVKNIQGFDCWSRKFPQSKIEWLKYLVSINYIKEIAKKYNNIKAVICYNYQVGALLKLKKYCNKNNIKLISDCTEWYEDKRLVKKIDTNIRMKYINKKIDGIICISSYLSNYYKDSIETIIIPPLIDIEEKKWELQHSKNISNTINFIYSGTPGKHKDKLNLVVEALSNLGTKFSFTFKIIGITKQQYLNYYPEHKAIIVRLENSVLFLGKVTHIESIEYVQNADFVIFIREDKRVNNAGFPTKFVESITCGTPVITTKTSDLFKYLIEGENGFFLNINNKEQIQSLLRKVIGMNNNEVMEMKRNCVESTTFHYQNYVENTGDFLSKVMK
ncbi:glycosyltransferase [Paenibacillus sp. Soil750]|uniref:glycosyltransferase n=1 Tax=Paenibacillus sp. Soil750 TaxID=1736398 RepID=UPI0006F8360A|nr:glycosyltransferase [Paenibacillus sp. Soil750]KRE57658.1 hypothetical protein ASL11_32670 [Paenibacillus sp. Soil750]